MNYPAGVSINHPHFDCEDKRAEVGYYVCVEDTIESRFDELHEAMDGAKAMCAEYNATFEPEGEKAVAKLFLVFDDDSKEELDTIIEYYGKDYSYKQVKRKWNKDDVAEASRLYNEEQAEHGNVEKMK